MKKLVALVLWLFPVLIFGQTTPTTGLIGKWLFSGNALDASLSANNGTVYGASLIYDRCGNANSAYHFNGTSDYIQLLATGPTGTLSRSMTYWERTTATTPYSMMVAFDYGTAYGAGDSFQSVWNYCSSGAGLDVSNQADIYGSSCLEDGRWHHIAMVYNATVSTVYSTLSYYFDGVLQSTTPACNVSGTSATINTGTVYPLTFGVGATSFVRYWSGDLDDFYLYNRPLDSGEVRQLYNMRCPVPIYGNTVVCAGSVNVYSVDPVSSASYTWLFPAGWTGSSTTNTISVTSGTASGVISVVITNSCATTTATLPVISIPPVSVTSSTSSICGTGTVTLMITGATSYTWLNTGITGSVVVVSPSVSTNYSVMVSNACGISTHILPVNVTPLPTASIVASNTLVCGSGNTTLTATGAATYTWLNTGANGSVAVMSPTANTVYTVVAGNSCGTATASIPITVLPIPTVTVTTSNSVVCSSGTATLMAISPAATGYTWVTTGANSSVTVVSPTVTTNYIVIAGNNCGNIVSSVQVSVMPLPTPTVTAINSIICKSGSATLTATGATTYTWLNTGTTGSVVIVSPSVSTVYTVVAGNTCGTTTAVFPITVLPLPTVTAVSSTPTLCPGSSATITASGALTYTWMATGSTNTIINVSPTVTTVYTVTGTDANGCSNKITIVQYVYVNPIVSTSYFGPNGQLCAGIPGTITATGADSYTWLPSFATGSTIVVAPLVSTNYTVIASFSLTGCTTTSVHGLVLGRARVTTTISATSPTFCVGDSIQLTAIDAGGGGGYTYTWNAVPGTSVLTVVPTTPGTFTCALYTMDMYHCYAIDTISLFLGSATVTASNLTVCPEVISTFTAQGTSTYTWQPGNITGSTYTVNPLAQSVYTVIGTAANGCTAEATPTLSLKPVPTFSFNTYTITCANLGSGTVTPIGGVGPFTYSWVPISQSGQAVTGLFPGTYTVTALDAGTGCLADTSVYFPTLAPFTGTLSATSSLTCYGVNTATAAMSLSGGSGAQNYTWTNAPGNETTPQAIGLAAGVHTVNVVDGLTFCSVTQTFLITQPPAPTLAVLPSSFSVCLGGTISFTAFASGGTPGYSYQWAGGPASYIEVVYEPTPGSYIYSVTSKDANNCSYTNTIAVNFVGRPPVTVTSSSMCLTDGTTLLAAGAASYLWQPGVNTGNALSVNPVANTSYTVTGSAFGCTNSAVSTVTVYPLPTVLVSNNSPVCTGLPLLLSSSATLVSTYNWSGPAVFSSTVPSPTVTSPGVNNSGVYSLTVTTVNGCTASAGASATILPLPVPVVQGASVCAHNSGTIHASGGLNYSWSGPVGYTATGPFAAISPIDSLSAGVYSVLVTDSNTCVKQATVMVVAYPYPLPTPLIGGPAKTCLNSVVNLDGQGGDAYLWQGPLHFNASSQHVSFTATNLNVSGIYTLTVKSSQGCLNSTTLALVIYPLPHVSFSSSKNDLCVPFCSDFVATPAVNNIAPVTGIYFTNNKSYFVDSVINYCFKGYGDFTMSIQYADTNNCSNSTELVEHVFPNPIANFNVSPAAPTALLDQVTLLDSSITSPNSLWAWIFSDRPPVLTKQPSPYTYDDPGSFPVALIVTNQWGCSDTMVKYINVSDDISLYVPNSFTPNDDGLNDVFMPKGRGIVKYNLQIFDRWGAKIFSTDDFYNGWDGFYKGQLCMQASYAWLIDFNGRDGKVRHYEGSVTLLR